MNYLLIFLDLHQHAKNQLILSIYSLDLINFRVQWPDWPDPFLTIPNHKVSNQLFIYISLCHHANQAILSIFSGDINDLNILQSDWLRALWPISRVFQIVLKSRGDGKFYWGVVGGRGGEGWVRVIKWWVSQEVWFYDFDSSNLFQS